MDAFDFISRIRQAGFTIGLMDGNLAISPASSLSDGQRQWIRDHKPELVSALRSPGAEIDSGQGGHDIAPANDQPLTLPCSLERAALALCDSYGDTASQKAEMIADLKHYSAESWPWLEAYFNETLVLMDLERIPPMVRCADCKRANVTKGIACCTVGVESGLPIGGFWATDRHLCNRYETTPSLIIQSVKPQIKIYPGNRNAKA